MFPLLAEHVIVDGNINPIDYYYGDGSETPADADAAVANFFYQCATNTNQNCGLGNGAAGDNGLQLLAKWNQYLAYLKTQGTQVVTDTNIYQAWYNAKQLMNNRLRDGPSKWVDYANYLATEWTKAGITVRGPTTKKRTLSKRDQITPTGVTPALADAAETAQAGKYALQAVTCGDYAAANNGVPANEATFKAARTAWNASSKYMYDQYLGTQFQCYAWETKAKEQFYPKTGQVKTLNPVLFVQTPFDPVTPSLSANNSRNTFSNAGLLQSTGAGVSCTPCEHRMI